jgi:chlorobactene glucosyltransferase
MELLTILQFCLVAWIVSWLLLNMIHLEKAEPVDGPLTHSPFVSICVPARNEERDLGACLQSLMAQNYPNFEVIAADDQSEDRTLEIIKHFERRFDNFIGFQGKPLPEDWLGKPYILSQAFSKTKGEYLLFTDADPVFEPFALKSAMFLMQKQKLDMLTLMPGASFGSFWERAVQPVIFGLIAGLTRFGDVNNPNNPKAMGIGAFILVKRSAYEKVSGHESVKKNVIEDIALGKVIKRSGHKIWIADGKSLFSIRMYHSLYEIWTGWKKNVFSAFKRSITRTISFAVTLIGFQLTPFLLLYLNWTTETFIWSFILSFLTIALTLATGIGLCKELKLNPLVALLFPLGSLVAIGIMFASMQQALIKNKTEWRGRVYTASETN